MYVCVLVIGNMQTEAGLGINISRGEGAWEWRRILVDRMGSTIITVTTECQVSIIRMFCLTSL